MKKFILLSLAITMAILVFTISFARQEEIREDQVVLAFITVSGYSNNLYIDNLTVGKQFTTDIMVGGINNIKADTSYSIGSNPFDVMPKVTVTNAGKTDISSSFDVVMEVTPGGYMSTRTIASLSKGMSQEVVFDNLTVTPGNENNITAYATLGTDDNPSNDTLRQYSMVLSGVQRNVLLEEWTSSTCGPCAQNNPTIDAFVHSNFDSVVAIKYHVGWPAPGDDPMYLYNPTQSYDRRYYYGVNAAPTVIMDGVTHPAYPYYTASSLPNAFGERIILGTPISVSVADTPLPGDSIQSNISVTVHSPLMSGDYYLRVHALERTINYSSPPGTNGETVFHDVFRKAYPNSIGIPIPTAVGTHDFVYKYKIDTNVWVDSMIYTAAFVQNDMTKEIMNCGKGRDQMLAVEKIASPHQPMSNDIKTVSFADDLIKALPTDVRDRYSGYTVNGGTFNLEIFESSFPPASWRIGNPDGGITFEQFTGANGNSFGGSKSVKMDFYSYSSIGATDTMYTEVYTSLSATDSIKFEWAHAEYPNYGPDRMIVKVSTDGGATFPTTIFDKSGSDLATAPSTTGSFIPNSGEWAMFEYPLAGIVSVDDEPNEIIHSFNLEQNYPNPFNPTTNIPFEIGGFKSVQAELIIYNSIGQKISVLVNEELSPGLYDLTWDGTDLNNQPVGSGIYFYRLSAGETRMIGKMILLR